MTDSYRAGSVSDGQLSSIDQGQQHKVPGRSAWFLFRLSTVENLVFLVLKRPAELGVADASGSVGKEQAVVGYHTSRMTPME